MTALELIKEQILKARETFIGTTSDITEDQLHKDPGGKALPLGATYAHLVFSEDIIINTFIQGKPALSETTFKDKTGVDSPMPPMDENWSEANEKWTKNVRVNLAQLREYEKAVYESTDQYINSLTDADLDKEIDLGNWGKMTIAFLLHGMIIAHTNSLTGEISALKGIQGAKGYPF